MVTITFVEGDGTEHAIESPVGENLMELATANSIPGIDGDCGGNCACATCHLYVPDELAAQITEEERDMLSIADNVTDASRLGCQIKVTEELDGLKVSIPEFQH